MTSVEDLSRELVIVVPVTKIANHLNHHRQLSVQIGLGLRLECGFFVDRILTIFEVMP